MSNTIVITGGTSGIGEAVVSRLVNRNFTLFNLDIQPAERHGVTDIMCDLASVNSISAAADALPPIVDALIHVAGIAPGDYPPDKVMQVNFLGMRSLTELLMPRIRRDGRITIVASSAGRDWQQNRDNVDAVLKAPLDTAKHWLDRHHDEWAAEAYRFSKQCAAAYTYVAAGLGRSNNVRVNCVNPGIVETQLSDQFRQMVGTDRYATIVEQSGRSGTPADIAEVIDYLATGDCGWMNGIEITLDGGYYAGLVGGWIDPA